MNAFSTFIKLLMGYVTVTVEGYFLEKFVNLCAIDKVPFWNVKRYGNAKMIGKTTINGFKNMRIEARKSGCKISLGKRYGGPFFLHRHKNKKIFLLGFFIFFIILKISGMFIWQINILGNSKIQSNEIYNNLIELGLKPGVLKKNVDVRNLASLLMTKRNDLTWVGVEITGVKAKVKIIEKDEVPKKIEDDVACDIISSKPALIVSINTYQGHQLVTSGDIVDNGELLVEGIMEMKQFPEKTKLVHSLAEIKGKVWYEKTRSLKLSKLRSNEEVEKMAYNLAYNNILREMPKNSEILNISKDVKYDKDKVSVTIIIENLENIGIERKR